mgnify:CR=1 FL=1
MMPILLYCLDFGERSEDVEVLKGEIAILFERVITVAVQLGENHRIEIAADQKDVLLARRARRVIIFDHKIKIDVLPGFLVLLEHGAEKRGHIIKGHAPRAAHAGGLVPGHAAADGFDFRFRLFNRRFNGFRHKQFFIVPVDLGIRPPFLAGNGVNRRTGM